MQAINYYLAITILILSGCASVTDNMASDSSASRNWEEILGPAQGDIPESDDLLSGPVHWLSNLNSARLLAKEKNKPLFVTFRCLPCKQCSRFDQEVLGASGALKESLRQFVTVRLTSMHDIDFRIFPVEQYQDLDLSWWGWFFSPDLEIYSVFGGKDHVSDTTRVSVTALNNACQRVLSHHYDTRRATWNLEDPAPNLDGDSKTPLEHEGLEPWLKNNEYAREQVYEENCLHCHQLAGVLMQPSIDEGAFNKDTDFDMWPFPENIGMSLDRDHGLLVANVSDKGSAMQAGILPGDIIAAIGDRKIFSQTDLRAVLHSSSPDTNSLECWWFREDKLMSGILKTEAGWKITNLSWRKSVAESDIGAHHGFPWPLKTSRAKRTRFGIADDKMAITPYFGKNWSGLARKGGLQGDHIITAVNGESPNLFGRAYLVWFRLNHEPGDTIIYSILNNEGESETVTFVARR